MLVQAKFAQVTLRLVGTSDFWMKKIVPVAFFHPVGGGGAVPAETMVGEELAPFVGKAAFLDIGMGAAACL
jgi:hypothetical protein